jgi:DNA-directed RNA polymerase specialized sigma24 family protein
LTSDQQVIEQLTSYRQKLARIQVLSSYHIGNGITVSRLNEDDQLQELHRKLKSMPSYMYLTKREQQLEQTAHAYLTHYPVGTRAQKRAIPVNVMDEEDAKLLQEIRDKIQKVIDSRGCHVDDLDEVLERVAELQDLQVEVEHIESVLEALEGYKPDYAKLLQLRYGRGFYRFTVCAEMHISDRTYTRRHKKALEEYAKLVGF